ncbi:hypothetical protein KY289_033218 [Solanum tuberosum]|nr:hypothetical protein KY289_033218 [Solanum tuberosum]
MRIRPDLWLKDDGSYNLAVFSLLTDNKKKVDTKKLFLTTLKNIKVPDGYSIHLVVEAKLGGPVHYQNMYPVERELGYCKPYVRNKSQLEGCIAEGHIAEKTLTFCSWYIEDIETRFNRPRRVHDEPTDMPSGMSSLFPQLGKPASASENFPLNPMQKLQAHRYVLLNCAIVTPFVE